MAKTVQSVVGDEVLDELKLQAEKRETTVSKLVRRLLERWTAKRRKDRETVEEEGKSYGC